MENPALFDLEPAPDSWHSSRRIGFDLETTGRDPRTARIVSAAVVVRDPAEAGPADGAPRIAEWLVDPGVEIPEEASAVHGITTEYARQNGSPADEAVPQILHRIIEELDAGTAVVIFNAPYDLSVLSAEAARYGADLPSPRPIIDPLVIDKQVDRYRRGKRTLGHMAEHYGIVLDDAHSAAPDAQAALEIGDALARRFPQLRMSAEELHDLQIGWKAEQAASLQEYFRRTRPDAVVDPSWPL
ncbi:MAG: 3'-5' exonuclease [Nesterenkonia sp.]|uniref:3'-5' exonuclease n=1 Tax=Nesterenkonia marinintestina TaxID=2979865 RepID=UPI0021BE6FD4|nr:3'-5' exonuclease [Nesterenkonia sp. GX14115]MDO5492615.1 3'-5' exonuclease [Nesterenkonia sp.]